MNCRLNLNIREVWDGYVLSKPPCLRRCGVFLLLRQPTVPQTGGGSFEEAGHQQVLGSRVARRKAAVVGGLGHDHGGSVLTGLAKSFLMYNRVETLDSLVRAIEGLTASDLMEVSNQWLGEDGLSSLTFTTPSKG